MNLRQRIVLTLLAIVVLLIAPAVYGLTALRELSGVAEQLRARDAVGALALGRAQSAFAEVENWERTYLAMAAYPGERTRARERVQANVVEMEQNLERLAQGGYSAAVTPALRQWRAVREALAREQELVESGAIDEADAFRSRAVDPALAAMDRTLTPIAEAINDTGRAQVERAQLVAATSATTTLAALAAAMLAALALAGWLTRSLLRPVRELRRGMAVVASGNFDPAIDVDSERPDELGDLARSFRRMTEQLDELDRLKAEFVSIASHELKTPLNVIKGYVSLLLDHIYGPVSAKQQEVLGAVSSQADRLGRLIQQLLDISRFEAGGGRLELRPVELETFFADLRTSFDALAQQNSIRFEVALDPGLPKTILADPDRLNEVVGNLLSNAFKFTPREGRICLTGTPVDNGIQVEVTDTGVGIPDDQLPRIFEKFYQVENEAQPKSVGSGLGLAIVREIVEGHGGTITAESRMGHGTTFRVVLPSDPAIRAAA